MTSVIKFPNGSVVHVDSFDELSKGKGNGTDYFVMPVHLNSIIGRITKGA